MWKMAILYCWRVRPQGQMSPKGQNWSNLVSDSWFLSFFLLFFLVCLVLLVTVINAQEESASPTVHMEVLAPYDLNIDIYFK